MAACLFAVVVGLSPFRSDSFKIPDRTEFVSYYYDDAILPALLHNIGSLPEAVKAANVLLLGSSIIEFAVSAATLNDRFRGTGLRFFNLGIAGGHSINTHDAIIRDLDLHDKVLIVTVDAPELTILDVDKDTVNIAWFQELREAVRMDRFNAATRVALVRSRAIVETFFDHIGYPHLAFDDGRLQLGPRNGRIGLRAFYTGDTVTSLTDWNPEAGTIPLRPDPDPRKRLNPARLDDPRFAAIIASWRARGMRLIFITFPRGDDYNPALAAEAAKRFGGEAVFIDWHNLMSPDGIHVDNAGRQNVTAQLAAQLADPALGLVGGVAAAPNQ